MNLTKAFEELTNFLKPRSEFLAVNFSGGVFALKSDEIETCFQREKILISFPHEKGFQTWRIATLTIEKTEMILDLSRNFGAEIENVRFVPRISAGELTAEIEIARIERANAIAQMIVSENERSRLIRVQVKKGNGRFARIIFEKDKTLIAAIADVSQTASAETNLAICILWLSKLECRRKKPIDHIWIIAEKRTAKSLQHLLALLTDEWNQKVTLIELVDGGDGRKLVNRKRLSMADLWRQKPGKLTLADKTNLSNTANEIIKLEPDKIDCVSTRNGESIRFLGLPFARIRKTYDVESCWFGIDSDRRILSQRSLDDFERMAVDLRNYRTAASPYKRHEFYRRAPEAWLESILRRNIRSLDANLVLSPIYNQFRAANDKIDLLALRRDGRLVIIELKVMPDRDMIFQGIDYWRKVELQRRKGVLTEAKIFGDLEIADKPTLVYLVAPTLSFHRDFDFFAKTISAEIGICRFELAENWRENLKVLRRKELNSCES